MGDHRDRPPITIRPAPSWRQAVMLTALHGVSLAVLIPLPLPVALRVVLAVLVGASLLYVIWARVLCLAPWSIAEVSWLASGWRVRTVAGGTFDARLAPSSYVGQHLVILNLRIGRLRQRSLVLTPDSVDADQLRRLRARLRLSGRSDLRQPASAA
jgi:toxin CptA